MSTNKELQDKARLLNEGGMGENNLPFFAVYSSKYSLFKRTLLGSIIMPQ